MSDPWRYTMMMFSLRDFHEYCKIFSLEAIFTEENSGILVTEDTDSICGVWACYNWSSPTSNIYVTML